MVADAEESINLAHYSSKLAYGRCKIEEVSCPHSVEGFDQCSRVSLHKVCSSLRLGINLTSSGFDQNVVMRPDPGSLGNDNCSLKVEAICFI